MWYLLIIAAIVLMFTCHVKSRGLQNPHMRRMLLRGQLPKLDIYLANRAATIFAASIVLVFICGSIFFSDPAGTALHQEIRRDAVQWRREVAIMLGQEIAGSINPGTKALLIFGQADQNEEYISAVKQGLSSGTGGKLDVSVIKNLHVPAPTRPDLVDETVELLTMSNSQLDEWVQSAGSDIRVVVSFVDLPANYHESRVFERATAKQLVVVAAVTTVYNLGFAIKAEGLHACVLPKQTFVKGGDDETKYAFDNRYLLITPRNLERTVKANRRIFRMNTKI